MLLEMMHLAVLSGRRSGSRRLFVVAPQTAWRYLEYAAAVAGLDSFVVFVDAAATMQGACMTPALAQLYSSCTLIESLLSVPVYHCKDAFAVVLVLTTGDKIVYSGDCRPSKALTAAGLGCDLLIHEATFDDEMSEDAVTKKHSTVSEAVSVGYAMRAKNNILTHFSQRYPHCPPIALLPGQQKFAVAFDFLTFYFPSQIKAVTELTSRFMAMSD
jgi:hypothetical protein